MGQLATDVGVHLLRGNRATGRGDAETALAEYRRAVETNSRSVPAHEALASALARVTWGKPTVRYKLARNLERIGQLEWIDDKPDVIPAGKPDAPRRTLQELWA